MNTKPILFYDIDGVLFGEYDREFQLRPGVKTWLKWAHEYFEVVWLTSWEAEKIQTLLTVLYCEEFLPIKHAKWITYANKETWLQEAISKLRGRDWFWIDDLIDRDIVSITACGFTRENCIQVNPEGEGVLEELREELEKLRYEEVVKALASR
jgi:hypothetical protein